MDDGKSFFSINIKVSKIRIIALLVIVIFFGIFYFLVEKPYRLKLEPSFPQGVFTRTEEQSKITWYNGLPGYPASNSYVWRKYFLIPHDCCANLQNQEQILTYLDDWLVKEGWVRWNEVGSPCSHLEQAEFLEGGKDYFPYVPRGTNSIMNSPAVCVAVWPADKNSKFYWALIATRNK